MSLNSADTAFANLLTEHLPKGSVSQTEPRYLEEPRGRYNGRHTFLVRPETVEQVSRVVCLAARERVGVVPYGGGTGLVGGQVSSEGPLPLLLSLERMNSVRAMYPAENVLICEAGTILADVQSAAESVDRLFPLSLASEGSARIGGNLATNAGGTAVLRYGNTRDLCLGLEAVLPDGQIWHGLKRLRKDNTGYDLRHLLIGSEGTLGIITAATLKLSPRPAVSGTAIFVVPSPEAALSLLAVARDRLGEMVSGFELISGQGLRFLKEVLPDIRQPFETTPEWSVLIEVGLVVGMDPQAALTGVFEEAAEQGFALDGVIAQSAQQADDFWSVREHIPEANKRVGAVISSDVSVPLGHIPEFISVGKQLIAEAGSFRINCFGHLGDGNLHYNIFALPGEKASDRADKRAQLQCIVHDLADRLGGSISAEHGIGRLKVDDLQRYGDPAKLSAMRAIKSALDPMGIMNPGAVLKITC